MSDKSKSNFRRSFETPRSPSRSTRSLEPPRLSEGPMMTSTSPRRRNKTSAIFLDRYIPNRTGVDLQAAFSLTNQDIYPDLRTRTNGTDNDIDLRKEEEANKIFSTILKAELFGDNVPMAAASLQNSSSGSKINHNNNNNVTTNNPSNNGNNSTRLPGNSAGGGNSLSSASSSGNLHTGGSGIGGAGGSGINITGGIGSRSTGELHSIHSTGSTPPRSTRINQAAVASAAAAAAAADSNSITSTPRQSTNLFTFQSPSKGRPISRDLQSELYSLSPVRQDSQKLLLSPQKKPRNISKVPYRVLDAPELSDDFYLNLVDWGSQDILAVGLGDSVYLWDGATQSVDRLCNLSNKDKVTSLNWIGSGTHLAIGTLKGLVEIWDATKIKCVRTMSGHNLRVSSLAWNEHILSSGSRDRSILNRDVRIADHFVNRFEHHKQEVCGLKWNVEENKLASGGNDNKLYIWDGLNPEPLHQFTDHTAAVKAIAWSPHQRGILASGGGTADKTIKTWNTLTGNLLHNVNTGSQVCNLAWSKNSNELVSTHGYSRNQVVVWKYPSMQQIALLTGHTYRVLYLSLSPDGETIVTGAGDETLRFWNVFEKNRNDEPPASVLLDAFLQLR